MSRKSNKNYQENHTYYYNKHNEDMVKDMRTKLRRKKRERRLKTAALIIIVVVIMFFIYTNFK